MPRTAHIPDADQQRWAIEFIEVIIAEAELQASLTDAFLRANGIESRPAAKPGPGSSSGDKKLADFLLGLGGALRVLGWERAGLKKRVAHDLPSAVQLFRALRAYFASDGVEGMSGAAISQAVLARALFRLSRLRESGTDCDIVLMIGSIPPELLNELATFLWMNRNLTGNAGE